jgi:hypothetical protein
VFGEGMNHALYIGRQRPLMPAPEIMMWTATIPFSSQKTPGKASSIIDTRCRKPVSGAHTPLI